MRPIQRLSLASRPKVALTARTRQTASHSATMEWIIGITLAVGVIVLVAVLVLRTKRQDGGTVPGRFNFDGYKESELTQRGVFDKTKWH